MIQDHLLPGGLMVTQRAPEISGALLFLCYKTNGLPLLKTQLSKLAFRSIWEYAEPMYVLAAQSIKGIEPAQ
jgi:hypothetical protein